MQIYSIIEDYKGSEKQTARIVNDIVSIKTS